MEFLVDNPAWQTQLQEHRATPRRCEVVIDSIGGRPVICGAPASFIVVRPNGRTFACPPHEIDSRRY